MTLSIVHKISLTSVFLVLFSAGVVGGLFYTKTAEHLVDHALNDIALEIRHAGNRLVSHITEQNADVVFLSHMTPIQGILRAQKTDGYDALGKSSNDHWKPRLEDIFASIMRIKSTYLKIRLIDKNGDELVVVGREGSNFVALAGEQLQNKAHRAYVKDTLKLSAGQVFLSEINLNREFGKVSEPLTEVLRSASPIFDGTNGEVAGVMLITAEISQELKKIQADVQSVSRKIYITNDDGGYLLHPDKNKAYGFDLGKQYRIQEDIPRSSRLFLPGNKDQNFILLPQDTDGSNVVSFTKIPFDASRPERFITVGVTQLYSDIVEEQNDVLNEVLLLALLMAAALTLLAIIFAYRLSRPIKLITQIMDDFTHNRLSTAIMPVDQMDEIGVLARSYQAMINQVDEAQSALKLTNSKLESMVADRTADLEMSEIFQRTLVENLVDGLLTIDDKGTIASFNPAAEKIFGYESDEVLGQNIKMLMPEPYHSEHDGYLADYKSTGDKKIIGIGRDVEGQRKGGTTFPLELAVSEMTLNGEKLYAGMVRDITERKQMEKMKNEFISTVSHELRTPLTSIRGSLGLMSGGAVGKLPEQAKDMLKIASNNTERLLLLINDILDIQKIESGQMAFNFQSLDIMSFLERAVEENASYGAQHGVKFVIANKIENFQVYGDKDRMMQVMANLLSNAAKFSPEDETVEISVAYHRETLRISVTDHGMGISEAFQPKLFDKFTQSDSSDTRQKGGTGLGLSITKIIVEKHGGHIGFVSREGIGTTFYIELPALMGEKKHGGESDAPRQLPDIHRACILIVEDDPDVAALLRRMLAEAGYNSDIAYDANEARQYLRDKPGQYKAITLDLILPGEDGISLLEGLRRDTATHDIPIVVVSVKADEAKRSLQGSAMDVLDWLSKPIDPARLVEAVKLAAGPNQKPRVLHVEDEPDVHQVVNVMLQDYCDLTWTTTLAASKEALETGEFDLVLLDIGLPDGSGLDLLEDIEKYLLPPRVVIFSAYDVSAEYTKRVSAVLTKSKNNNFRLAEVINSVLKCGTNPSKI